MATHSRLTRNLAREAGVTMEGDPGARRWAMLKRVATVLCGVVLVGGSVAMIPGARAADVTYVTGGVGADSREELQAKESEYNLKSVVAATSGDYLADVKIVIEAPSNE